VDGYWLCQSAVTPIPAWDSKIRLLTAPRFWHGRGCLPLGIGESRYCPIRWADRPPQVVVSMTHTELKHPTDISNTSCGTVVGFIPVPRSRRRLVCQQIALRFATALKREAFSSILRKRRRKRIQLLFPVIEGHTLSNDYYDNDLCVLTRTVSSQPPVVYRGSSRLSQGLPGGMFTIYDNQTH